MSSDLNENTQMAAATGPCATSASSHPATSNLAPTPPSMAPMPSPTPPSPLLVGEGSGVRSEGSGVRLKIRTLAPLLRRENVKAILGLAEIMSVEIRVRFIDGHTDSKHITLAPGGSLAILLLEDNPDNVPGGAFYDISPLSS